MSSGHLHNPSYPRQYPHYPYGGGYTSTSMGYSRSQESDGSSNSMTSSHSQSPYSTSPGSSPNSSNRGHTGYTGGYNGQHHGQGQAGPPSHTGSHSGTGDNGRSARRSSNSQPPNTTASSSASSNRYPCLWPRCEYTAARAYDLGRHVNTHSPETVQRLDCPYARNGFCGRMGERGFTRDDHRKEHIRKVHPRPR